MGNTLQQKIASLEDNERRELYDHMNSKTLTNQDNIFSFRLLIEAEIEREITAKDIHKSSGIKQISTYLLKN